MICVYYLVYCMRIPILGNGIKKRREKKVDPSDLCQDLCLDIFFSPPVTIQNRCNLEEVVNAEIVMFPVPC